jgi:hypothetical protein
MVWSKYDSEKIGEIKIEDVERWKLIFRYSEKWEINEVN